MIPKEKQINLRISDELYEWLKEYSDHVDKAMSAIIRELLMELRKKESEAQHTQESQK